MCALIPEGQSCQQASLFQSSFRRTGLLVFITGESVSRDRKEEQRKEKEGGTLVGLYWRLSSED